MNVTYVVVNLALGVAMLIIGAPMWIWRRRTADDAPRTPGRLPRQHGPGVAIVLRGEEMARQDRQAIRRAKLRVLGPVLVCLAPVCLIAGLVELLKN